MAGGGDLGFYIGSYDGTGGGGTPDADATLFLTSRGYTQARGYEYWDSTNSVMKKWDGTNWQQLSGGLSGTYTFGGGSSGDIASMTFVDGVLTAVTTVP
jgi:hypothetical protein